MLKFRHLSLRRKQTLIIMLTSSVVLLLACAAFVTYDVARFRREMVESTSSLAEVVGNSTTAAIDFNDPPAAVQILGALRGEPNIVKAQVHTLDGQIFAGYAREGAPPPPEVTGSLKGGHVFTARHLHLFRPIAQGGEQVGTIELVAGLGELQNRLWRYAGIVMGVFGAAMLAAFGLSNWLQRLVSAPILHLAQVARLVALDKNYSLRATKQSDDEIGQLVEGFNEMLGQIQQREAALQSARQELEHRVEERTGELAYERELLRALLDYSPDPIYFKDTESRFIKSSKAHAKLFGLKGADELVGRKDSDFFAEEHARPALEDEQEIIRTGVALVGKVEKEVMKDGRECWALTNKMPLRNRDGQIIGTFGISKDITAIKRTEARLEQAHRQLVETSRQAGMAEIATNVLHNVGNVLNSVNVSAGLVVEGVKKSRISNLAKVVVMLREHASDLGAFMTNDSKGRQLPDYLAQLAKHLLADQAALIEEVDSLRRNVEHIKEIVAMQQNYATVGGVKEMVNVVSLVEDSLQMNEGALSRHRVKVVREFEPVPLMNVEKHKIVQIVVNLLRNAKHACQDSRRPDRHMTVRVVKADNCVRISVSDNGVGIPPENLTRIFSHGFTTKKGGHGFGLHSGALAAKEMDGSLQVQSDGPGCGATFTLELPCAAPEGTHE